jgi:hypothetical protein
MDISVPLEHKLSVLDGVRERPEDNRGNHLVLIKPWEQIVWLRSVERDRAAGVFSSRALARTPCSSPSPLS